MQTLGHDRAGRMIGDKKLSSFLLQQPAVAIRVAERGEGAVAGVIGAGPLRRPLVPSGWN